ncbi:T9SS type A sorting domain-containing protein [Bacteroides sp.]
MKRFIITPLLMLLASFLFSAYAGDTYIAGFEDGEEGYQINTGWAQGYVGEIVANTDASGINTSDKCYMATITDAVPDRWGLWVIISLNEPVTITEANRYVKIMAKRSPNNVNMALCIQGEDPLGPNTLFGLSKPTQAGVWGDMVFDLFQSSNPDVSCENREIKELMICLGTWDGTEPGVTMLDNIVFSDNAKPRGAKDINPGLLVNFEDEDLTTNNFAGFNVQSQEAKCQIVDNPVSAGINTTAKCLEYTKPANTTWWHAAISVVNGVIPVEYPNSYLHIMAYIPDETPFYVIAKSPSGKEIKEVMYPEDGEGWYDYVLDVSEMDYISEICFRFNYVSEEDWENPAGKYYLDDYALTDSVDPRDAPTSTGMNKTDVSENLNVYVENGIVSVSSSDLKSASIYSVSGQLISQQAAIGTVANFTLPAGIYVVKAENTSGEISVRKLVVK